MKYLKPFNEKFNISDLEEYCNNYLAYLLDEENFYIKYNDSLRLSQSRLSDPTLVLKSKNHFNWDDIKDYFIPFLNILIKEYNIKEVKFDGIKININNILKDDIKATHSFIKFNYDVLKEIEVRFSLNQDKYRAKRGL